MKIILFVLTIFLACAGATKPPTPYPNMYLDLQPGQYYIYNGGSSNGGWHIGHFFEAVGNWFMSPRQASPHHMVMCLHGDNLIETESGESIEVRDLMSLAEGDADEATFYSGADGDGSETFVQAQTWISKYENSTHEVAYTKICAEDSLQEESCVKLTSNHALLRLNGGKQYVRADQLLVDDTIQGKDDEELKITSKSETMEPASLYMPVSKDSFFINVGKIAVPLVSDFGPSFDMQHDVYAAYSGFANDWEVYDVLGIMDDLYALSPDAPHQGVLISQVMDYLVEAYGSGRRALRTEKDDTIILNPARFIAANNPEYANIMWAAENFALLVSISSITLLLVLGLTIYMCCGKSIYACCWGGKKSKDAEKADEENVGNKKLSKETKEIVIEV